VCRLKPNLADAVPKRRARRGFGRRLIGLACLVVLAGCARAPPGSPQPEPVTPAASAEAVAAPARSAGEQLRLTVMTYNILGGLAPSNWYPMIPARELDPLVRAPLIADKISSAAPDLVGLQEYPVGSATAQRIEAALSDYHWLPGPGEHAIAVKAERFDVLSNGAQKISTRGTLGSVFDRYADWVQLRERVSGRIVWFVNVHSHPWQTKAYAKVRSAAITELIGLISRLDPGYREPLVLAGDFNANSAERRPVFSDHLTKLRAAGLVDAATVARIDDSDVPGAESLNQMGAKVAGVKVGKVVSRGGRYIDYIWVPAAATVESWAVRSGPGVEWRTIRGQEQVPIWTGIIPSDHSPVLAEVSFAAMGR